MNDMKKINAKAGSPGIAVGKLVTFSTWRIPEKQTVSDISSETAAIDKAVSDVCAVYEQRINAASKMDDSETAEILSAQLMLVKDSALHQAILDVINSEHACAAYAAYMGVEKFAQEIEQLEDAYMRARGQDIRGIGRKLADAVRGISCDITLTEDSILFAEDLMPEEIVSLEKRHIKGIVTLRGSNVSHTAILAGTYGIPYLFDPESLEELSDGDTVIADGNEGILIIRPSDETIEECRKRILEQESVDEDIPEELPVKLYANIAGPADLDMVESNGGEGIGLFRTEFLFMNRNTLPSEEEQFEIYKEVAERMYPREVIIRTMDIGTDKQTDCLPLEDEENPALGRRAIRICLDEPELFRTQLRALLRAACFGDLKIMYPMIASGWELDEADIQLKAAAEELRARKENYRIPSCGIMIETPAAALCSDILAEKADFFSIGTNDLTQYTLAADRRGRDMEKYFDSQHEAVFRLIDLVVKNAHARGVAVGICGELGGIPEAIPKLLKSGVDELSMSPGRLRAVRKAVSDHVKSTFEFDEPLTAPADGILVKMEDIPDEVFSSGTLGKCIAVDPVESGTVYAPCSGEITMVAETRHAIGIRSDAGSDILIHSGIDTVSLNGEGFECRVSEGQHVSQGEVIMIEDVQLIRKHDLSPMVIMVYGMPFSGRASELNG